MENLLIAKFIQLSYLGQRLKETGDTVLIEGNTWHDNYWGVCECGRCKGGVNKLGELLMKVRGTL
jgi:hypothetical protein